MVDFLEGELKYEFIQQVVQFIPATLEGIIYRKVAHLLDLTPLLPGELLRRNLDQAWAGIIMG